MGCKVRTQNNSCGHKGALIDKFIAPPLFSMANILPTASLRGSERSVALFAPWAALSYAARGRPPSDLLRPPAEQPQPHAECAFMGQRVRDRRGRATWGLEADKLSTVAPGYVYRDALLTELNCSHLQPHDRQASSATPDGPIQSGPFEGALPHYRAFRFVLAVENTDAGSPVSEKMVNAYLAGAVPIVWGGGLHRRVFNPQSFVDCTGLAVAACAATVRAVDATAWQAMRAAARFASPRDFERFFAWYDAPLGSDGGVSTAQAALREAIGSRLASVTGCAESSAH